jgi:hypothetical protein
MLWCDVHAGRGDVKIAAQQKDAPDEAKRRLTGRNGKPTNVLADSTLESRPAANASRWADALERRRMIAPFEYCSKCGLVYCHIQNIECVVCHGELEPIEGLLIPERRPTPRALDGSIRALESVEYRVEWVDADTVRLTPRQ